MASMSSTYAPSGPASTALPSRTTPLVSVIVLNYNGARWLERCLGTLREQTIFSQMEVIVADNNSPDKSDILAAKLMVGWSNGRVVQHGTNLGFCEGNNRAARQARGQWLFFLNNDTWLEPRCLETLIYETKSAGAQASGPMVLNYEDDSFQSLGAAGFDCFGLTSMRRFHTDRRPVFMPEGCAYLIERTVFHRLGGFDPEFFMFHDEFDLSFRLWIAGYMAVAVPQARLHHRGAAQVNPSGGEKVVEFRTSDLKRFYTNRNSILTFLKNARGLLLLALPLQIALLALEHVVGLILVRRWSFVRRAFFEAVSDCWRLRHHVVKERRQLKQLRQRGDLWMTRFLCLRLNRWDEVVRIRRAGIPKVGAS